MQDQKKFKDKYMKLDQVASGTYGIVYKGRNIETRQLCAVKKFKKVNSEGMPTSAVRQIYALKNIESQYILPILDIYIKKDSIKLVVPWKNLTLTDLISKYQNYNINMIIFELIKAVHSIHVNNYMHRDLKPSNIVLDQGQNINLKLIDFGMAKQIPYISKNKAHKLTNQVGTLYYRAPELLIARRDYDTKIDVWAIGCIFYELMTKKILFKGKSEIEQLTLIYNLVGGKQDHQKIRQMGKIIGQIKQDNWKWISHTLSQKGFGQKQVDLLDKMLKVDPQIRASCQQLLQHTYFIESDLQK